MSLDYAWQTFFSAVRDAVASDDPPRKRLEELYAASIGKLRGDEKVREDIAQRISTLRSSREKFSQMNADEIRKSLREIVSIYDAISAELYSTHATKHRD